VIVVVESGCVGVPLTEHEATSGTVVVGTVGAGGTVEAGPVGWVVWTATLGWLVGVGAGDPGVFEICFPELWDACPKVDEVDDVAGATLAELSADEERGTVVLAVVGVLGAVCRTDSVVPQPATNVEMKTKPASIETIRRYCMPLLYCRRATAPAEQRYRSVRPSSQGAGPILQVGYL
jgi:hypothetical protein